MIDAVGIGETEVDCAGGLRLVAVERVQLAHQLSPTDPGRQPRTDAQAVALPAAQGHAQVIALGEVILEQQQGAATNLANENLHPAIVAEIAGNDTAAIAFVVHARQKAHVEEGLPASVQPGAIALEGAEVMASFDDLPGVLDPEFVQRLIDLPGSGDACRTIARL